MDVPSSFSSGTLPASGTLATAVGQGSPPFTIQLDSTNASRAVSISADGGNLFVPLPFTNTTVTAAMVVFNGPVSQFLFAGAAGDKWSVL